MSGDAKHELDALAVEAANDAKLDADPGPAKETQQRDTAAEWAAAISMAVQFGAAAYPSIRPIYTAEVIAQLAGAVDAVARKYDFGIDDLFARWKEEIGLAVIAFPLAKATADAVRADRAAKEQPMPDAGAAPAASVPSSSPAKVAPIA